MGGSLPSRKVGEVLFLTKFLIKLRLVCVLESVSLCLYSSSNVVVIYLQRGDSLSPHFLFPLPLLSQPAGLGGPARSEEGACRFCTLCGVVRTTLGA